MYGIIGFGFMAFFGLWVLYGIFRLWVKVFGSKEDNEALDKGPEVSKKKGFRVERW